MRDSIRFARLLRSPCLIYYFLIFLYAPNWPVPYPDPPSNPAPEQWSNLYPNPYPISIPDPDPNPTPGQCLADAQALADGGLPEAAAGLSVSLRPHDRQAARVGLGGPGSSLLARHVQALLEVGELLTLDEGVFVSSVSSDGSSMSMASSAPILGLMRTVARRYHTPPAPSSADRDGEDSGAHSRSDRGQSHFHSAVANLLSALVGVLRPDAGPASQGLVKKILAEEARNARGGGLGTPSGGGSKGRKPSRGQEQGPEAGDLIARVFGAEGAGSGVGEADADDEDSNTPGGDVNASSASASASATATTTPRKKSSTLRALRNTLGAGLGLGGRARRNEEQAARTWKHVKADGELIDLDAVRREKARAVVALTNSGDIEAAMQMCVEDRLNIVVSGGTSTGKTTFARALLAKRQAA